MDKQSKAAEDAAILTTSIVGSKRMREAQHERNRQVSELYRKSIWADEVIEKVVTYGQCLYVIGEDTIEVHGPKDVFRIPEDGRNDDKTMG